MYRSKPQDASTSFLEALQLRPEFADAHYNLARSLLIQGDFEQGWLEYEWRNSYTTGQLPGKTLRRWGGLPLADRSILIRTEQGLGDTLMFIRYVSLVRQGGGRIVVECPRHLHPLLKLMDGIDQLVDSGDDIPNCDVQTRLLSLPGLLGTRLTTVPAEVPYLSADPSLIAVWKSRLDAISGFRIGVAWQGNPHFDGDRYRSIPLTAFEPLAKIPGVSLVSLQKGEGCEQMPAASVRVPVIDFGPELDAASGAFMDTAAIMQNLDLVITSDSAVAHLAGALGIPTWIVLSSAPDFRWLTDRADSPWYPTLQLFRQERLGDWKEVFGRIADAVRRHMSPLAKSPATVSVGSKIDAESYHQRGRKAFEQGNTGLALDCFQRALRSKPNVAQVHHDLGVAFATKRQYSAAIEHFQKAIECDADFTQAYGNLALALMDHGDNAEAVKTLRVALQADPNASLLHQRLGVALQQTNRAEEAIKSLLTAAEQLPDSASVHHDLGLAYRSNGQLELAIRNYRRAIELRSDFPEAHNHLGVALAAQRHHEESIESYQRAVQLRPDYPEAYNNLGVSLADLHRLDESVEAFQQALYFRPDAVETHKNLALVLLLQGNLAQGWLEYEWRWKSVAPPVPNGVRWNGSQLEGNTLLLCAEQGLGDTIQFIRYARLAKERGAKVILECQPPLVPILSEYESVDQVIAQGDIRPEFDVYSPLLSLPCTFRTTLDNIPAQIPYLHPDPELVGKWKEYLADVGEFRIGIAWKGSDNYAGDAERSIALKYFGPLAELPGVRLISLQKGLGTEQLDELPTSHKILIPEGLDENVGAFKDTAAIISQLDLVVCSDSAVAHLAGALGNEVWMPLCRPNDWRWMRERKDCPWYPKMKLFRQAASGGWQPVFRTIATAIKRRVTSKRKKRAKVKDV